MNASSEKYYALLAKDSNPVGICVVTLLAWLALSDGDLSAAERELILQFAGRERVEHAVDTVWEVAGGADTELLTVVFQGLLCIPVEHRKTVVDMAIVVTLADGVLRNAENLALHVVTESLGLSAYTLNARFKLATGSDLPSPGDPSDRGWWDARNSGKSRSTSNHGANRNKSESWSYRGPEVSQRLKDLGLLGLDDSASIDDIRSAYRRMAQIHHPDRYSALGPEAVAAAEATFLRIAAAYERLSGS